MQQLTSKPTPRPRRSAWIKALLIALGIVAYLISTVPVGIALYVIKTEMGWDIFKHGGFHTLAACLRTAARP